MARKYVLANSLIASACFASVTRDLRLRFKGQPSSIRSGELLAAFWALTHNDARRVQIVVGPYPRVGIPGENDVVPPVAAPDAVGEPTGIVDLITAVASGSILRTWSMTASTELVSKSWRPGRSR